MPILRLRICCALQETTWLFNVVSAYISNTLAQEEKANAVAAVGSAGVVGTSSAAAAAAAVGGSAAGPSSSAAAAAVGVGAAPVPADEVKGG